MGAGYQRPRTGFEGFQRMLKDINRRLDALAAGAGIKSAVLGDGDSITTRGTGTITSETVGGPATRLSQGLVQVRPTPADEWVPFKDDVLAAVEPVAPSSSPVPALITGRETIWVHVPRVDYPPEVGEVVVAVYLSTVTPVVESPATLAGYAPNGGVLAVRGVNGVALTPVTDYYALTRAVSAGGLAADPSAEVGPVQVDPELPFPITETAIADGAVSTPKLQANSVTAEKVSSDIIVVNDIYTQNGVYVANGSGAVLDITAEQGIRLFDTTGALRISFPTVPDEAGRIIAQLFANVYALSLTVEDNLSVRGLQNEIARGAVVTIASGTTKPQSPPSPSAAWDTKPIFGGGGYSSRGMAKYGADWYGTETLFGGQVHKFVETTPGSLTADDWTRTSPWSLPADQWPIGGIAFQGTKAYVLVRDFTRTTGSPYYIAKWYVYEYTVATGVKTNEWQYQPTGTDSGLYSTKDPVIGVKGSNLLIAQPRETDNLIQIREYQIDGTQVAGFTTDFQSNSHVTGVLYGDFDFGTPRYVVAHINTATIRVLSTAGVLQPNEHFGAPAGSGIAGIAWDATNGVFITRYNNDITRHTAITWTSTALDRWWPAHSWFDSDVAGTGLHETPISDPVSFLHPKRAKLLITIPTLPPRADPPTTDDAVAARLYIGRGATKPAVSAMYREATDLANGQTLVTLRTNPTGSLPANTGTPPAFPAATPGKLQDSAGGYWDGLGNANLPKLIQTLDSGWAALTLAAGYVELSAPYTPRIRIIGNRVEMRGIVKPSSGSFTTAAVTVMTLPAQYRPTYIAHLATTGSTGAITCRLIVNDDGIVQVQPGATTAYVTIAATWLLG